MMERNINLSLVEQLALQELLTPLCKAQAEMKYVMSVPLTNYIKPKEIDALNFLKQELNIYSQEKFEHWCLMHGLTTLKQATSYALFKHKRHQVIEFLLRGSGESLYLRYKDRLDRVLYSILRVESENLAQQLYYAIDSKDIEFGEAAAQHSCGPEAKTQGLVGPVDLTTPHPEVAARLRTASPRQLFEPFKADEWHAVIRLEYRFDSEYDSKTKQFLGGLVLNSKVKNEAESLIADFLSSNSDIS